MCEIPLCVSFSEDFYTFVQLFTNKWVDQDAHKGYWDMYWRIETGASLSKHIREGLAWKIGDVRALGVM